MIIKCFSDLKINLFKLFFNPNKKKKIVHIYKIRKGYAGEYVGLGVSSELTNQYLNEFGFNSKSFGVVDDNKIDKILHEERPDFLIVKAFWIRKEKLELLSKKYKKTKFIIVSHSKPSFLGAETKGFERLFEIIQLSKEHKNIFLGINNTDFYENIKSITSKVIYVPNIILPKDEKKNETDYYTLNVGLFCAIRPMKNIMNSALSAISAANELDKKLNLYVITNRVEMGGEITLKNLRDLFNNLDPERYKLIELNWMDHEKFHKIVKNMDIGLQASFTESFNIVSIDFINNNIPIITSPSISWSSEIFQTNPDNITEMKDRIVLLLNYNIISKFGVDISYKKLIDYNIEGLLQYEKIINNHYRF